MEKKIKLELSYSEVAAIAEAFGVASGVLINEYPRGYDRILTANASIHNKVCGALGCVGYRVDDIKFGGAWRWFRRLYDWGFNKAQNVRMIEHCGKKNATPYLHEQVGREEVA